MASPLGTPRFFWLPAVEIFRVGNWQGTDYTSQDLDDVVRNFEALSTGRTPLHEPALYVDPTDGVTLNTASLGHEAESPILDGLVAQDRTDMPSAGWVRRVWREGDSVFADIRRIPEDVARWIEEGRYKHCSSELYPEPPEGVPGSGRMLRRVAFLGAEPPHIKQLADLPKPLPDSSSFSEAAAVAAGCLPLPKLRCFSEGPTMTPEQVQAALLGAGYPQTLLDKLDDSEKAMLAAKLTPAAPAAPVTPAEALAEGDFDRAAAEAEALSLGASDPAGMSDDELKAWLAQAKASAAAPAAAPAAMSEKGKPASFSEVQVRRFAEAAVAKALANQRKQTLANQQELDRQRQELRAAAAKQRGADFDAFAERMVQKGIPPALFDGGTLKQIALSLAAQPQKFAEGDLTPYDALCRHLEKCVPAMKLGQALGVSGKPQTTAEEAKAKVVQHFSENAGQFKKLGVTQELRLKSWEANRARGKTVEEFLGAAA